LMVADIVPEKAKEVSNEIEAVGRKSLSFAVDVSNGRQVKEMVKNASDYFGRIDILVNVAGTSMRSAVEDASEEEWDRVIAVNLKGPFLCSQEVGREMIRQGGGSIVNFASVAAHTPNIYSGSYSPSKAGVVMLTKGMAVEWAKYNIRVNAVSPGPIETAMAARRYKTESQRKARASAVPMNRFGRPEEIANAVVFLASDEASYITGHTLVIDGGSLNSMFYLVSRLEE
jgi:NAD(P)-dependent dehydrogenase (short-subunit alcohol dehydrogenase family)